MRYRPLSAHESLARLVKPTQSGSIQTYPVNVHRVGHLYDPDTYQGIFLLKRPIEQC
jgi:hypothetical protein